MAGVGRCPLGLTHLITDMPGAPARVQGMRVRPDGPQLISEMIRKELGLDCRSVVVD